MALGLFLYTSCLKSDSDSNREYSNDTAIYSFDLTTVNCYMHTTSKSGGDSVYKKVLTKPVAFTIDHYQQKIYNTDSLPYEADLKHVLASITSVNNGAIVINYNSSANTDSLMYYTSTDSIDFTKAKEIQVYAQDGSGSRNYTLTVNKHQIASGRLIWDKKTMADLPDESWRLTWENKVAAAGLKQFIGKGEAEAYAYTEGGQLMVSWDGGTTWMEDIVEDNKPLPTENYAFASWPFAANDSTDYQMIIGTYSLNDDACVVWRKIAEYAYRSLPSQWVELTTDSRNPYCLPKMEHLNLVYYCGNVLAIGDNGKIYVSRDQGRTWKTDSEYILPANIGTHYLKAITDDNGFLWLVGKDTGEVWRGKMIE